MGIVKRAAHRLPMDRECRPELTSFSPEDSTPSFSLLQETEEGGRVVFASVVAAVEERFQQLHHVKDLLPV